MTSKARLRGGPRIDKNKHEAKGMYLFVPVFYDEPAYFGMKTCDSFDCPKRGKHKVEDWRSLFKQKYELTMSYDVKTKKKSFYWDFRGIEP